MAKRLSLTTALHLSLVAVEHDHLAALVAAYERTIREAARVASDGFALVAAATDWQPPVDGAVLTVAQLRSLGNDLNDALEPVWDAIVTDTAKQPLARIEIAWDVKHPLAKNLLAQAAKRTGTRLGEAVQSTLRETVKHAYDNGLDVRQTTALIRSKITDAAPYQAEMLARTDLNSLGNGASHAAAQLAGMGYKTWLATLDDKTRIEHAEAHGQTVALNGAFTVGGEDADYPGDPALSDAMAANCRCTVAYGQTLDEAQGLTAAGLPSSDEKGIMRGMATLKQRRRRYERRAAKGKPAAVPTIMAGEGGADDGLVSGALIAAAIPPKSTPVVDRPWDGPANVAKIANDAGASVLRGMYAFVIPGKDPATKAAYHLPHHEVVDGKPGPANIAGVRNAMGRAAQIKPPLSDTDMAGVRAHLQRHIDDFNRQNKNAMTAAARAIPFSGTGAIEGQIADDNTLTPRVLLPGSLEWPEMPVSFMAQTVTAEGHDGAEVAGRVDEFARKKSTGKKNAIYMSGELTTPFGINEIAPMVEDETMRYVSADLGAAEWAIVGRDTLAEIPMDELNMDDLHSGAYALGLKSGKIKAMTLVATQALEGAMISLTASADTPGDATLVFPVELVLGTPVALIASPAPLNPPRSWFETQEPPGKMPLTVTKEGRVYGHLATWDSCHASFLPQCVPPPRSPSNYARFHTAYLDTEEGDEISVGKLMFSPGNGGHADRRLTAAKASAHYDKTGMAAAYLRASDGQYGIWVAGAINPDLTDEQREQMRRELRLNPPSGDWRVWDGQYDLLCGLAVAIPGFGVEAAAEVSIIASAHGVEMRDALIASSGWFDADDAAVAALEHEGLIDEELHADRQIRALAARAEGLDSLAALVD